MAGSGRSGDGRTLSEKLAHLFGTVHPASRGPYSNAEVAREIRAAADDDAGLSASAIAQLRSGAKTNPTMKTIEALASFFGVPPAYFFDDAVARQTDAEIAEITAMRDVQSVAMRASGLSEGSLKMVLAVIDHARALEGLPELDEGEPPTGS
ncbi:hypothetical protein GCM10023205_04670 [Yinghuangia aomiensis]|uniref:HTH cro/C1-type domain-containing protein n=1 Tax=Yinghuangia aomiensis TaxID=676205 RepID=A0ABP9GM11_9ACTN